MQKGANPPLSLIVNLLTYGTCAALPQMVQKPQQFSSDGSTNEQWEEVCGLQVALRGGVQRSSRRSNPSAVGRPAGPHSCTAGFLGSELCFNFLENTHFCITSNAFSQTAAVTAERSQGLSRRALPIFIKKSPPPFQEPSLL